MKPHLLLLILSISILASAQFKEVPFDFFPMVQSGDVGASNSTKNISNPCSILFKLSEKVDNFDHIKELLQHYQLKSF